MRDWVSPLSTATEPALTALAPLLTTALKAADAAVAAGRTAAQQLTDLLEIGDCKVLLDKANALRKATYGKLAELVHDKPEAHLPADFADQFFLQESRWSAPDREELLARNDKHDARMRQQLKELEAEQESARQSERDARADAIRTELAPAARRRADEQAREAALKAQLDQLTGPGTPAPAPPSPPT